MKRLYKTKEEFLNEPNVTIRNKIKNVLNQWLENTEGREVLHDSDIEDLKYGLEEIGVYIQWKALYDFLGVDEED